MFIHSLPFMFIVSYQTCVHLIVHVWHVVHLYFSKCIECMIALLDNEQSMVHECVAEDLPEQQPGEGKCPLTHYVLHYNSPSQITLLKLKD